MHGGGMMMVSGSGYGQTHFGGGRPESRMRDHLSENVRRMRQIQRQSKEREASAHQPVKALWKSEKYSGITSKIKDDIQRPPSAPRPKSANFLRAHSRNGPSVKNVSRPCTPDPPAEKLTVPPARCSSEIKFHRNNLDFIKINGISAKHQMMKRSPSVNALDELKKKEEEEYGKHQRGEVPKYLKVRKDQWKKEEKDRIANTPDPEMPPGHRLLPEKERQETLKLLLIKEKELVNELSALPLRMDTFRIRSQKQELEGKIAEIDEAKKIFNRPKVFVKVDS
ncbi:enkurin domain-containing protein 1-like [Saccostrea cucullata]|uniref:enkurin domain-containing protein 1-like n=1 Tax=Saccostrea cuccullata TaxID=36930 RepID=UPI002ED415B0